MISAFKRIMIVATVVACGGVSASAQISYSFLPTEGVWNNWENWWPASGPPTSIDDAEIPNGSTCRIENDNAFVYDLTVYGVLQIKGKDLTIYGGATVNGDIEFHKPGGTDPRLVAANDITVDGSGTISASDGDGLDPGIITHAGVGLDKLTLDTVTVEGSVTFLTHLDMTNGAELLVDDDDDEMVIGYLTGSPPEMELDGDLGTAYTVSAGTLKIGYTKNMYCRSEWDVSVGTLELTEYATHVSWQDTGHPVKVSSGTLLLNELFITNGGLEFTGGTIQVAAGKSALFSKK